MGQETASFGSTGQDPAPRPATGIPCAPPLTLPWLAVSVPLIGIGALVFCCCLAVCALLVLYAQVGLDGLSDFYQELRFDIPLKTQIGAALVASLYLGVATMTLGAAVLRGRRHWTALVALTPVNDGSRLAVAISVAVLALVYAAAATLAMTWGQDHHLMDGGPTDLALLGTIAANLVLLAPCAEELFFRGWLYTGLRRRLSFWPSFLLTASLFAAFHWDANHRRIFLVLPLALALGLLREVTGSIKPTIALHAVYNLIIVVITLLET